MHPDGVAEREEAHGEGAEGEEDQEGQAHEDSVGDDGVVGEAALGAGGEGWVEELVGRMMGRRSTWTYQARADRRGWRASSLLQYY